MKDFIYQLALGIACTIIAIVLCTAFTFKGKDLHGSGIAIIVNKENPINDLTISEVKLYWLRKIKKRWPELNKNIKPADRKSKCPEQDTFYGKVLNMAASDVETYFIQKQYDSAEKPQDKFASDAAMIEFVASEPGAIGYVSKSAAATAEGIKVVLTVE